jgi:hypothetical protein
MNRIVVKILRWSEHSVEHKISSRYRKKNLVLCSDNIGASDCDIHRIYRLLQQNLARSRNINDDYVNY